MYILIACFVIKAITTVVNIHWVMEKLLSSSRFLLLVVVILKVLSLFVLIYPVSPLVCYLQSVPKITISPKSHISSK